MKKKTIILISILAVVAIMIVGSVYYYFFVQKSLQLKYPNGKEIWEANKTYRITWQARKIGRVGIMLIKEGSKSSEWIAKDVSALDGKYDWNIFVWQEPRQDYRISIFEYPWQPGQKVDYSDDDFTITGPEFASCDSLSLEKEWPFLPSDFPNLRKVFITNSSWNGNLEGLEGADKKCQAEAESEGFQGTWKAFLGSDQTLATDRLNLDGIFVNARSSATLPEGKTCHQLWGKSFDDFFKKLSDTLAINREKFDETFLQKELADVWLGRITKDSKRDCTVVFAKFAAIDQNKVYSFTTTCQNWTIGAETVPGYQSAGSQTTDFPKCYNTQGLLVNAVSLSGLSVGIAGKEGAEYFSPFLGKLCNLSQKLICIQQ